MLACACKKREECRGELNLICAPFNRVWLTLQMCVGGAEARRRRSPSSSN